MMAFRLAHGISYGIVDGATIALDLDRDRYVRLRNDAASALAGLASGRPAPVEPCAGIATLLNARILTEGDGMPVAPASLQCPDRSALEIARIPASSVATIHCATANYTVRRWLRSHGLASTVTRLQRVRRDANLRVENCRAVALAQCYIRTRRSLPGARTCVPDSFALSLLLSRYGIAHDVAFGVALSPFAAHAWTQTDDHILSDYADPVRAFQPVFVL